MDEDNLDPKEEELKGEVELPEPDDDVLGTEEDDDLLSHTHKKKISDDETGEDEDASLDELADEELDDEDEPYDDVDHW